MSHTMVATAVRTQRKPMPPVTAVTALKTGGRKGAAYSPQHTGAEFELLIAHDEWEKAEMTVDAPERGLWPLLAPHATADGDDVGVVPNVAVGVRVCDADLVAPAAP